MVQILGKEVVAPARPISLTKQQRLNIRQLSYYQALKNEEYSAETIYKLWPTDKESHWKAGDRPSITAIKQFKATEEYRELMLEVGIEVTEVTQLNERQIMTLKKLSETGDKRSKTAQLKALGVSTTEWRGWMRQQEFYESFQKMVGGSVKDALLMSEVKLADMAESGDLNAIKFLWEYTGKHNPSQQQALDAQQLMNVMIDSAQEIFGKADPELFKEFIEMVRLKASTVKGMVM
jgi:hypothetical protein